MKYFHRTSLPIDDVLAQADAFFGAQLSPEHGDGRERRFRGTIGAVSVAVQAEGGHYTLVTATTDQVAESEADKLVKRFLGTVHAKADPSHQLRGAY